MHRFYLGDMPQQPLAQVPVDAQWDWQEKGACRSADPTLFFHPQNERGEVVITTDGPDYHPFMSYAQRGDLRRELYRASVSRATPRNIEVLQGMLEKRHELATLLGYRSWAEYVTEDKMIASAGNAVAFVERTAAAARTRLGAELAVMLAMARRD